MPTHPLTTGPEAVLAVDGLRKHFGPTVALQDAALRLFPGEVHALVGENGSGKSTLVKILSGVHRPDTGSMTVGGRAFAPRNPAQALRAGIDTVFQEVLGVENRTVLDNLWLGADRPLRPVARDAGRREKAAEVLAALLVTPPPLDAPFGSLQLSDRQACGIARSLLRDPRVLILDEATSALDLDTRTRLFTLVKERAAQGMSVVLITHRMDEIREIGDRVTVLRSGRTVGTLGADWDHDEMIRLMTGGAHLVPPADSSEPAACDPAERPVVLRVTGSRLRPGGQPCHAEFRRGEIVGLAGLEGHGQDEFLRLLLGHGDTEGVVRTEGDGEHRVTDPRRARDLGIAYVARDRRGESILPWMSILDNFAVATADRDVRGGLLSEAAAERRFAHYVERLAIKYGRSSDAVTTLSGGNQQKVVIARWLAADPEILLLNDPTRGIDVGAKRDLYRLLRELSAQGLTVVMLSSEVDEHVELMDRVLVFREGSLAAGLARTELDRERLVDAFFDGAAVTA
ncbi:sugar ABC transporter ATP-binding protein [Streptomyces fuscichromogenes]|uniref:Ribose import ATP-binding protein RbsA 1 n=1 Tax=Streptomyces fuscichromogenes TaxID=1324013 RepID=A0A918CVL9_9ACTN|nr:sugar ABC transporter ATP-binding protein [Streptomyces fuscichromogenes]GGN33818.1 ribose import ATP-binding protein RbsA 1 [Streptomyces fuscichromogenes]